MPAAKNSANKKKKDTSKQTEASAGVQLDVIFAGPLLFVPIVNDGNITSVDIYCPRNGHPVGAVLTPGTFFTDDELDQPDGGKWPEPNSFTLLDPHSYAVHLQQTGERVPFPLSSIPDPNHKIKPGRKLSADWEVAISLFGELSKWSSHRYIPVEKGAYAGSDAPTVDKVAGLHRLTYQSVTGAEFCGVETAAKNYMAANLGKGGSLIVIGEIPYQSTIAHERLAIDSMAKLAGLNLRLNSDSPVTNRTRLMNHVHNCGSSVILA